MIDARIGEVWNRLFVAKNKAGGLIPAVRLSEWVRGQKGRAIALANESTSPDFALVGFGNAAEVGDDGWTIMPFGEWPHSEGIQQFATEQAQAIVDNFKKGWGRFKRAIIGLPVYKGHPDLKGLENEYPDRTEYGQIADMEVRAQGLAIKQVLSTAGAKLVDRGLRFISPHWLCNAIGERNGVKIYVPVLMKSVGLTNKPNIPNKSLINTAESTLMKKELLIQILGLVPLANATEVTEAQIEETIRANMARPTADALANEKSATLVAVNRAQTAETDLAKVRTDLATASTTLANEKKNAIKQLVDGSVKLGIISVAEKPTWERRLDRDFETESVSLVNSNPAIKTKPTVEAARLAALDAKLKTQGASTLVNEGEVAPSIASLVNEEMASPAVANIKNPSKRYNTAFANAAKKYPKIFEPVIPAGV